MIQIKLNTQKREQQGQISQSNSDLENRIDKVVKLELEMEEMRSSYRQLEKHAQSLEEDAGNIHEKYRNLVEDHSRLEADHEALDRKLQRREKKIALREQELVDYVERSAEQLGVIRKLKEELATTTGIIIDSASNK